MERLKSILGILMWFVMSTVIAYHIGIVDQNPMLGTFPYIFIQWLIFDDRSFVTNHGEFALQALSLEQVLVF